MIIKYYTIPFTESYMQGSSAKQDVFYGDVKKWGGLKRLNRKGGEKMHNNERECYVVEELQKQG